MIPLFISSDTIKEFSIIESNVDVKLIDSTIILVQDIQLQQLLGSQLYNEIAGQINSDPQVISSANQTLLTDYIKPFMLNAVIAEGVVTFNYKISNKAVVTMNSESQQPVNTSEIELVQSKYQGYADFYAKRLTAFLVQETTTYPLYQTVVDSSDMAAKAAKYNSGFYLGNKRRNERRNPPLYPDCLHCD